MASLEARYAVYYAPEEDSPLGIFGQEWLNPIERHPPSWVEDADLWSQATASPAHYGFHATLKAPFRLASGQTEAKFLEAAGLLADDLASFDTPAVKLNELGRYLALTFGATCPQMETLHRRCVVDLDRFRAPLSEADRQRRVSSGLTTRQRKLLEQHGYPFVMDEFEFHLTLAGPLDSEPRARTKELLIDRANDHSYPGLHVDSICIFFQTDSKRPFRLLQRFRFAG